MSALAAALLKKIESRTARTGVVGLGYVGLPLAVEFARAGFHATGIDLDERKIQAINEGQSYIPDVSTADVQALRPRPASWTRRPTSPSSGSSTPSTSACRRRCARPRTPTCPTSSRRSRRSPKHLHPGMLIVLESTTYPGTTDEVVQPMLEATGLKAGVDFFLAFSPERVDPGNPNFQTHNVPKVVGGLTRRRARSWPARSTAPRSRRSCR